jgi:hypothetical protein
VYSQPTGDNLDKPVKIVGKNAAVSTASLPPKERLPEKGGGANKFPIVYTCCKIVTMDCENGPKASVLSQRYTLPHRAAR